MPLPIERLRTAALAQLTEHERHSCVVYLARASVTAGETLAFPQCTFTCPFDGHVAFVDLDPMANWGHACCYLCLDPRTGDASRVDAQFPPFGANTDRAAWEVMYRAPSVPEALVMIRET
jgi:hypothetical protein